jgi:hypothetical protein
LDRFAFAIGDWGFTIDERLVIRGSDWKGSLQEIEFSEETHQIAHLHRGKVVNRKS